MKTLSLQTKYLVSHVALGLICVFCVSALQIYYRFDSSMVRVTDDLKALQSRAAPALAAALKARDRTELQRLASDLFEFPSVAFVKLEGTGLEPISIGQSSASRLAPSRQFALSHRSPAAVEPVGSLTLQASRHRLLHQLWHDTRVSLVASAALLLLLAVAATGLLRALVLQDLRELARRLSAASDNGSPRPRPAPVQDELSALQTQLERLQRVQNERANRAHQALKKFEALAENNPEVLWCLELAEGLDTGADANLQVQNIVEHGRLSHLNAPAKALLQGETDTLQGVAALPIITTEMLLELVQSQYQLRNAISHCHDHQGQVRHFRNCLSCWIDQGKVRAIWGIAFETTETHTTQKALEQREQQLHISQARLSEAQALAHMGHWSYYVKNDQLTISDEFARIYGFGPDEPPPSWARLQLRIHPEDKSHVLNTLSDPKTQAVGAEHRIVWPNGEIRFVQAIARKHISLGKVDSTFGILIDITDRKRAEEARGRSQRALAESEARMAQAQAIAHMGHWLLDCATLMLSCSDEFFRLLDLAPQEHQLDQATFINHVHPEDQALILQLLDAAQQKSSTQQFRVIRRDGIERFMRGTFTPYYAGGRNSPRIFGIMMDVTEQKQIEIQLRASQELFATAFDSSPDGIFFIDAHDHRFIKHNRALSRMLNMRDSQLLNKNFDQIDVRLEKSPDTHACEQMRSQPHANNIEVRIECEAAATVSALFSWQQVTIAQKLCVLGVIRDVTPIRRLQRTAEEQKRQLIQADKLASIGTMVAGVAHEINNPNHLIQMNAELLEEFCKPIINALTELPFERRENVVNGIPFEELHRTIPELLSDLKASSQRINRIVSDLKDFARPQENSERLPLELNQLLNNTIGLFSAVLEKRRGSLKTEFAQDLPLIRADSQRFEQVLVNLIMNAIEASDDASPIKLRTYFDTGEPSVVCEIEDFGCGISEELLDKIFDPFFTTKQAQGGTGLGLAISYRLIQEHGGTLSAHRKAEGGAIMRIRLPLAQTH